MESVRHWAPELQRIVVLVDRVTGISTLMMKASRWYFRKTRTSKSQVVSFKYTTLELSTAVKPYAIEFLLHRFKLDKIIYSIRT